MTPRDFSEIVICLLDPMFLPPPPEMTYDHLRSMVQRWKTYIDTGIFVLSVPVATPLGGGADGALAEFWTSPLPYWDLKIHAPELWNFLSQSNLVILKVRHLHCVPCGQLSICRGISSEWKMHEQSNMIEFVCPATASASIQTFICFRWHSLQFPQ